LLRPALQRDITVQVHFGSPVVAADLHHDQFRVREAVLQKISTMLTYAAS
jgi:hypothetical protein